jgi:argininosuccinate lyase
VSEQPEKQELIRERFTKPLTEIAHRFSSSIALDKKLYREDIAGSIAHVTMLAAVGVLSNSESDVIASGLREIEEEIANGAFVLDDHLEDIHLAIEQRLTEKIGALGGKLHTGRSRNDQVALDERIYLKRAIANLLNILRELQSALVTKAEENLGTVMPGYTHMQRAQPVLLSHHLLAYVEMLERDHSRLSDAAKRLNFSPLGSAAFAGTPYPLDRAMVADALGFDGALRNSIDGVSDRDYLIEVASACSIAMMHLSRFAEELVIWSTKEFGFVQMSDAVTTGSSIMPQKKNPDMAELVRGKTGRVYGALFNLLTIMKSLPLAYNRDMQEDKQPMFDAIETTADCLQMMRVLVEESTFSKERMQEALRDGHLTATDLADYLVLKGATFREAHGVTGRLVGYCDSADKQLWEIDLAVLKEFSSLIDPDIYDALDPIKSVDRKQSSGSTATNEVRSQIDRWKLSLQL